MVGPVHYFNAGVDSTCSWRAIWMCVSPRLAHACGVFQGRQAASLCDYTSCCCCLLLLLLQASCDNLADCRVNSYRGMGVSLSDSTLTYMPQAYPLLTNRSDILSMSMSASGGRQGCAADPPFPSISLSCTRVNANPSRRSLHSTNAHAALRNC
jgi:hypothetical protein